MKKLTLLVFVLSTVLFGCGPFSKDSVPVGAPGTVAAPMEQDYRIHVGDRLAIRMFYNPDLNQEVTVRPDGRISLLLVHEVAAVGRTPAELTSALAESYSKYLQQPEIAVIVNSFGGNRVFVGGEVKEPGARDLVGPTTVLQAVMLSGGFKDTARTNEVVIIRRDDQGKAILIGLDAEAAMRGADPSQDIYVKPYDIVLVPRSNIADVDLWITQYIGIPFSVGSNFLLYYDIINN